MTKHNNILGLLLFLCYIVSSQIDDTGLKLVQVTTLTRHGSRAPDKILAKVSCTPLLPMKPNSGLTEVFVDKFGTLPGELTFFGEEQMEEVGRFIKLRYGKQGLDFINTDDFFRKTTDWQFIARAGSRQQRSMMALAQGLFPGTAVPIAVTDRDTDNVLGGPAPSCGTITAQMIVDWHATKGKELVQKYYASAVQPFEKLCNVSLIDNPVNAAPGGANPHAWVGDISDLLDSMLENLPPTELPKVDKKNYFALTKLAFALEQESHYEDPRGAVMFAGDFPKQLLETFEGIQKDPLGKRPRGTPKFRLNVCSRELEYGLSHLFGWEHDIMLPGEPTGRVRAGSTLIFELWKDAKGEYYIETLMFQPGNKGLIDIQPKTRVSQFRRQYELAIQKTGDWREICKDASIPTSPDGDDIDVVHETHTSGFWFVFFLLVALALYFVYQRGFRRGGEYQQL